MQEKENIARLYDLYSNDMYEMTDEMKQIQKQRNKYIETLMKSMTEEQKKLLDNIINLETDERQAEHRQIFTFAFSLATNLFKEGLDKE